MATENVHKFWWYDPMSLFAPETKFDCIPKAEQSYTDRLNSISRLVIYSSIILFLLSNNFFAIVIGAFTLLVIAQMYTTSIVEPMTNAANEKVPEPTLNNPFMNPLVGEAPKGEAPKLHEVPEVSQEVNRFANYNLFKSQDDLYGRDNPDHIFYTVASTTTPIDEGMRFREFLNMTPGKKTCKQDPKQCGVLSDLKRQGPILFADSNSN